MAIFVWISLLLHTMKSHFIFKEYVWLVNLLLRKGRMSLNEINKEWVHTDMSGGLEFARNTFIRHKNAVEEIFGLLIECDAHDEYKYYISNGYVLHEDSVQNWMLSTITVNTLLTDNISLADRIVLESVPSENSLLHAIIKAMKHKVRIKIVYRKYDHVEMSQVTFAPYCLRLFQCRWYVLGQFQRPAREYEKPCKRKGLPKGFIEYFRTYSLDRIKELQLTEEKFEIDQEFSAAEYFEDCFGVFRDDSKPIQKVTVRAYGLQRYYMRDLPWHHSQRELFWGDKYADYEFTLRPTDDFIRHVIRYGNLIKVLSPTDLARDVRDKLLATAEIYNDLED